MMSSKGQVVVPKRVRQALQADAGCEIAFELNGDKVTMFVLRTKSATAAAGYGLLKGRGRKVRLENWDAELGKSLRRSA